MRSITYTSAAVKELSQNEIIDLLNRSRANNLKFGITGLLLYKNGAFIQTIEGEEAHVGQLYQNICKDDINHRVSKILDEEIEERAFPNWAMGFIDLEKTEVAGYSDFLHYNTNLDSFWNPPSNAKYLLYSFRDVTR